MFRRLLFALAFVAIATVPAAAVPLRIATFEADVTPPLGTPLCDALVGAGQADRRSALCARDHFMARRTADCPLRP